MRVTRRSFLERAALAAAAVAGAPALARDLLAQGTAQGNAKKPVQNTAPKASEFVFARLRYDSGDWDYNPKVAANVLDAVLQYTTIQVQQQEVVIAADSTELDAYPFVFMTGHKLVRFSERERKGLARFVDNGGLLFSDDCNHDVN